MGASRRNRRWAFYSGNRLVGVVVCDEATALLHAHATGLHVVRQA